MAFFSAIGGAIGTAIFGAGSFFAGATATLFQAAAGIGLNMLARAIAGRDDGPEKPEFALRGKLQAGGDVPRSFMFGRGMTAGSLVYANSWGEAAGTPNAYLTQVIALSDLPVKALDEVWINGEKVTLDTDDAHPQRGYPVTEYRLDGKDYLWVKFHDGTQTQADNFLVNKVSSDERPYEDTRAGVGIAYAICTARVNEELFTGFPSFKFVIDGIRLYDPTQDSSVGGSGDQRWSSPATWGGDGDYLPAVQLYNVLRGISFDGDWVYGLQSLAAARLPASEWRAQIAKCRTNVDGPDGEENRYRSSGEISVGTEVADTVQALLTACQGRLAESGGAYSLRLGAPDSSVATISDGVILSTEEQTFTPFFGLAETVTGINATYPSPDEGWTTKVAPPRIDPDLEVLAGNRRLLADVRLDLVPYKGQVQRLMKSALKEAQRARRHTIVLPPEYAVLRPGDYIDWTSARNGYVTKQFRIDGVIDRANLDIILDITEVDPDDYDWNQDADYRVPVDGSVGVSRPAPQVITGFGVEAVTIQSSDGQDTRPAIRLFWDWSDDDTDIDAVQFQVRQAFNQSVIVRDRIGDPEAGEVIIAHFALVKSTDYEVRARFVSKSRKRRMSWSSWLPVTTPNVAITDIAVYLEQLQQDFVREMQRRQDEFDKEFDRMRETIADIVHNQIGSIQDAMIALRGNKRVSAQVFEEREQREELGESFSSYTIATDAALTTIDGQLEGQANSILNLDSRVTETEDGIEANSSALISVNARVDDAESGISGLSTSFSLLEGRVEANEDGIEVESSKLDAVISQIVNPDNTTGPLGIAFNDLYSKATKKIGSDDLEESYARNIAGTIASTKYGTASGLVGWVAKSNKPVGAEARFQIQGRASANGQTSYGGLFLDVFPDRTEMLINVDSFKVSNTAGSTKYLPFSIENGEVAMALARVKEIRSGLIRSQNNTMTIDLDSGEIIIRD